MFLAMTPRPPIDLSPFISLRGARSRQGRSYRRGRTFGPSHRVRLTGLRPSPGDLEERATEGGLADPPLSCGSGDDRVGDRETEARTAAVIGRPMKAVEEPLLLLGCYARSAVLNRERDPVPSRYHADPHVATLTCVPAGVVDEDADQPVDPFRWRADARRRGIFRFLHRYRE